MYEAVVIGGSAGSLEELLTLFRGLPKGYPLPVIVVVHLHASDNGALINLLNSQVAVEVKEAREKHRIAPGAVYIAPANYHLLVDDDRTFALSVDEKVNYARPSIDVLFESAAFVYYDGLVGILLTGANTDGVKGICTIKRYGGFTVAQNPDTAQYSIMPKAALSSGCVDKILTHTLLTDILR